MSSARNNLKKIYADYPLYWDFLLVMSTVAWTTMLVQPYTYNSLLPLLIPLVFPAFYTSLLMHRRKILGLKPGQLIERIAMVTVVTGFVTLWILVPSDLSFAEVSKLISILILLLLFNMIGLLLFLIFFAMIGRSDI